MSSQGFDPDELGPECPWTHALGLDPLTVVKIHYTPWILKTFGQYNRIALLRPDIDMKQSVFIYEGGCQLQCTFKL